MKPGVNFINILPAHFCTKVCSKPNSKQRKVAELAFVQKSVLKMLMKLKLEKQLKES
jgi:hypothetical protein